MANDILLALVAWSGGVLCGVGATTYTKMKAASVLALSAATTGLGAATLYMIFG